MTEIKSYSHTFAALTNLQIAVDSLFKTAAARE
jgi:hypothetical protein